MVNDISTILNSIVDHVGFADSKTEYMKYIRWSSTKDVRTFADWIYSQPGPYLERKHEKFYS